MTTYAFLTKDSFRVDVEATSPRAAYRKLMSIPFFRHRITTAYIKYDKDGLAALDGWRGLTPDEARP